MPLVHGADADDTTGDNAELTVRSSSYATSVPAPTPAPAPAAPAPAPSDITVADVECDAATEVEEVLVTPNGAHAGAAPARLSIRPMQLVSGDNLARASVVNGDRAADDVAAVPGTGTGTTGNGDGDDDGGGGSDGSGGGWGSAELRRRRANAEPPTANEGLERRPRNLGSMSLVEMGAKESAKESLPDFGSGRKFSSGGSIFRSASVPDSPQHLRSGTSMYLDQFRHPNRIWESPAMSQLYPPGGVASCGPGADAFRLLSVGSASSAGSACTLVGPDQPTERLVQNHAVHSARYPTFNVKRKHKRIVFPGATKSRMKGWWHYMVHMNTLFLVPIVFVVYILVFVAFVPIYMGISDRCGLEIGKASGQPFLDALYLSTETMTTIGYGVDDHFYNGCPEGLVCVMGQALVGFMMNAVLFGTIFARVSRAQRRAISIKFAPSCVIREVRGRFFLCAQVVESQQYQVISSAVSVFVTLQDTQNQTPYQCHACRTIRPDDCLNQELLLCIPNQIVHEIDMWSPLTPPLDNTEDRDGFDDTCAYAYEWPAVRQRVDDISSGNRPAYHCIVCGAAFNSVSLLRRHTAHEARQDMLNNKDDDTAMCVFCGEEHLWKPTDIDDRDYDAPGDLAAATGTLEHHIKTHHDKQRSTTEVFGRHWIKAQKKAHACNYNCIGNRQDGFEHAGPHKFSRAEIMNWMTNTDPEVIVLVSAADPVTGSPFMAQHSYSGDSIVWDKMFKPCVLPDEHAKATVDFKKFVELEHAPPVQFGEDPGYVQFHL